MEDNFSKNTGIRIEECFSAFENDFISPKELNSYKLFLRTKLVSSFNVLQQNFNNENFTALPICCHDNTDEYCKINPNYTRIRGWICICNIGIPYITLASHSILKSASGDFIDITPTISQHNYKFLPAYIDNASFDKLVRHIYDMQGNTNINIEKPA